MPNGLFAAICLIALLLALVASVANKDFDHTYKHPLWRLCKVAVGLALMGLCLTWVASSDPSAAPNVIYRAHSEFMLAMAWLVFGCSAVYAIVQFIWTICSTIAARLERRKISPTLTC